MANVGTVDRAIRALLGIAALVAAFTVPQLAAGWPHWVAIAVGAILVLTSLLAVCPAYLPFGIRTCKAR